MRIAVIGSFGTSGDQHYRVHQPAAPLAADPLTLTMTMDLEAFRLICQSRLLGSSRHRSRLSARFTRTTPSRSTPLSRARHQHANNAYLSLQQQR